MSLLAKEAKQILDSIVSKKLSMEEIEKIRKSLDKLDQYEKATDSLRYNLGPICWLYKQYPDRESEGHKEIDKVVKYISRLQDDEYRDESVLYYIAECIQKGETKYLNNFIEEHNDSDIDSIVSDLRYEMENNYVPEDN